MEAMRGLGVDRHLFGLYCVARGTNMDPLPDIFNDKVTPFCEQSSSAFIFILYPHKHAQAFNLKFLLSTSQTPVRTTDRWREEVSSLAGGFGTVFDDGYGVSYLVYEDYGKSFKGFFQRVFMGKCTCTELPLWYSISYYFLSLLHSNLECS